jgi:hypothetical protein
MKILYEVECTVILQGNKRVMAVIPRRRSGKFLDAGRGLVG